MFNYAYGKGEVNFKEGEIIFTLADKQYSIIKMYIAPYSEIIKCDISPENYELHTILYPDGFFIIDFI